MGTNTVKQIHDCWSQQDKRDFIDVGIRLTDFTHDDAPTLEKGNTQLWVNANLRLHRTTGPAIIGDSFIKWYLDNKGYSFSDWSKKVNLSAERLELLKTIYGEHI